jgi:hypothetical protein
MKISKILDTVALNAYGLFSIFQPAPETREALSEGAHKISEAKAALKSVKGQVYASTLALNTAHTLERSALKDKQTQERALLRANAAEAISTAKDNLSTVRERAVESVAESRRRRLAESGFALAAGAA